MLVASLSLAGPAPRRPTGFLATAQHLSEAPNLWTQGSIPGAAMLDGSFILATSAIHLITVVSACLLGLTQAKVALNTHPSGFPVPFLLRSHMDHT